MQECEPEGNREERDRREVFKKQHIKHTKLILITASMLAANSKSYRPSPQRRDLGLHCRDILKIRETLGACCEVSLLLRAVL